MMVREGCSLHSLCINSLCSIISRFYYIIHQNMLHPFSYTQLVTMTMQQPEELFLEVSHPADTRQHITNAPSRPSKAVFLRFFSRTSPLPADLSNLNQNDQPGRGGGAANWSTASPPPRSITVTQIVKVHRAPHDLRNTVLINAGMEVSSCTTGLIKLLWGGLRWSTCDVMWTLIKCGLLFWTSVPLAWGNSGIMPPLPHPPSVSTTPLTSSCVCTSPAL